jgi:hypothetical protein
MAKDNREAVFVVQRGGTRLYRVVERKENGVIVKDDSGRECFFENGSYEFVHIGTDYAKPGVDLACKIEVDADGAITALKALQREARKATQALRELEAEVAKAKTTNITVNIPNITVKDDADIKNIAKMLAEKLSSTKTLHETLVKREGVEEYTVDAHGGYAKISIDNGESGANIIVEGPAKIVVNRD